MTKTETPYERYYKEYVNCDFCGQQTKGRIYVDQPTAVHCGACNRVMINHPVPQSAKQ